MTVETGECNGGRSGGDPKVAEEIGGSYVIVNGGGDHSSEEDLDLDHDHKEKKKTPDPSGAKEKNGGAGVSEKEAVPEENGDGASAVVERSVAEMEGEEDNGGADVSEEKERSSESAVTNDAKEVTEDGVTEGNGEDGEPVPSAVTEKGDGGLPVVEISAAADVAIEQEKGAEVEDNGDVETTDDKEETTCVAVVEKVHTDVYTEAETGSGSETIAESQQPEFEIAPAETDNRGQSEVEDVKESVAEVIVEVEDVKESEPVIVSESVETAVVEESGNPELVESAAEVEGGQSKQQPEDPVNNELVPASKVERVHEDDSLEAETKSGSDMKVEEVQEPKIASVKNEDRGESELLVKVEDVKESETEIRLNVNDVKESELVILSESVEPVVEETGNVVLESTAEVEVESRQQPEDPVAEDYKVEVEVKELETGVRLEDSDVKESESVIVPESVEPVVELTCNAEDYKVEVEDYKVEVEDAKELETGFRLEDLDVKESESVIVPESVEHLVEETCNAEDYKVEVEETGVRLEDSDVMESESVIVPESVEPVVEETCNAELVESAAEVEVESRQQPEDPVAEDDKVEAEEIKEPDSVLEEAVAEDTNVKEFVTEEENREDPSSVIEKADNITSNPEPESVVSEADRVEVEQKEEPESSGEALRTGTATAVEPADSVVIESTASECFPIENEVAEIPNVESDAPTDEQSVQLETKANYVCDDIISVSTEKVDRSNNGECIECPKGLLKGVARSIDDKHLELGSVNDGTTDQLEPKPSNSGQLVEPISWGTVPRDAELKTTDLQPNTDCELETDVSVELVATDKGAADHVGGMESKSDNGSDSIEGGECKASSTEENRSANKDDGEEPSHGEAAAAETIQAPSEAHVVKRHPVYLIKVGRFIDDELEKKIQQAVLELHEKTRIRDSVQEDIRKKLVTLKQYDQEFEDAFAKENAQRAIFNEKQEEIDGVQVLVNRINNATSIADIDEKIQNMVHRQQHDTIDLKQEKHYIREINKLKRLREQLSLKAPQEEINEALAQRAEVYTRLEKLKKELKPLRDVLKSATNSSYELRKRSLAERDLVKRLRDQYFVANRIRQEAYMQLQELRKQSAEKFKHFSMYKADQNIAANFRFSGDNEGLRTHCSRQIERIMELWNNNDDFRKDYIKSNVNSTLRRLGTLDGRSLGPGEEAPIVSPYMDRKPKSLSLPSSNVETSAPLVASGGKQEASAPLVALEGKQEKSEALATKQVTRTNHLVKSTVKAKSITKEVVPTISLSPEPQKDEKETNKLEELAKKEEELERKEEEQRMGMTAKEEELRKEKAAAEMKEKLILEQKIKAKEAEERKRRKSEKAQAKADFRAQKEAELKEKKKAKKEMKRAYGTESRNGDIDGQTAPVTDTASSEASVTEEAETTVKSTSKRSSRPAAAVKQYDRVQPLPLPLRNRGKRKMTTWTWVILTALLVLLLFFAGNYVTVSSFSIPDLGF